LQSFENKANKEIQNVDNWFIYLVFSD